MGRADQGLGSWISRRARTTPRRPAVVFEGRSTTYAELDERIRRLANALLAMGLQPGHRVGYVGPNHPSFLETLFATASLGAVFVPVNPALPSELIGFELEDAGCRALVHAEGVRGSEEVPTVVPVGAAYESLLAHAEPEPFHREVDLDDLAVLPYTSGTTGRPKGVMLTHGNLTWNVVNMLGTIDFQAGEPTLATAPLYRMGGLGVTVLETLFVGGTVVLMAERDPDEALSLLERHRIALLFGAPDILDGVVRSPAWTRTDLSNVRACVTGGTTIPERLVRAFLDRGVPLNPGYGLTEAAPVVSLLPSDDLARKPDSTGPPVPLCEVRVVDEDLADVPPGDTGEIMVRGPNVTAGYWGRPEASPLTAEGWLRTGDAGRLDDEGYLSVLDRLSDAYTIDGRRAYPSDVERVLLEHPWVVECAVAGLPDGAGSEIGVAFVVLDARVGPGSDPADLLGYARARLSRPDMLERVRVVDRIPRNPVGKVLRRELRARAGA